QDAYFFFNIDKITKESPEGSFGMVAALADKDQFEKILKDSAPEQVSFVKQSGYTMVNNPDDPEVTIAYNNEVLIIGGYLSDDMDKPAAPMMAEFFAKKGASIASNSAWKALAGEDHDIAQFFNLDPVFAALGDEIKPQLAMVGIDEKALIGNYLTAFTDFRNGEVYSETGYFLNDDLTKDINMFFKDEVKTDFSKYVPADAQVAYMTFGLDIKGVEQVLKEKGMLGLVNMQMAQMGLSTADLSKGFGGDIMLSVHLEGEDEGFGLFGMDITDREILDKFIALGEQVGALSKEGDDQYIINNTSDAIGKFILFDPTAGQDARMVIKDNKVFITDRQEVYAKIMSGGFSGAKAMNKDLHKELADNLWGLNMSFAPVEAMIQKELPGFNMESIKATTTKKKSESTLYMKDKSENVLKSLVKLMNEAYLKEKERENDWQWEEAPEEDSDKM
ncbi:MAG: DUF4836 family protein, partial [Bacteroidota bacterium]